MLGSKQNILTGTATCVFVAMCLVIFTWNNVVGKFHVSVAYLFVCSFKGCIGQVKHLCQPSLRSRNSTGMTLRV